MRARNWGCLVALAACGGRSGLDVDEPARDASVASDAMDAAVETIDVDAGNDASAIVDVLNCSSLPVASCACPSPCSAPFDTVLQDAIAECSTHAFACGFVNVTFDSNGCVETFDYTTGEATKEFRACFEDAVTSQRWPCEEGATLTAYLGSCTVH